MSEDSGAPRVKYCVPGTQAKETVPTAVKVQWLWDVRYIDAPVLMWRDTDGNGALDETLYFCNDANMNVTALVNTSGTVVERYMYDAYGKPLFLKADWTLQVSGQPDGTASAYANEILYCGYRFDSETGLYHARHRYYHPTLGRWGTCDPEGYREGANLHQYCRCSPTGWVDPLGLGETIIENVPSCQVIVSVEITAELGKVAGNVSMGGEVGIKRPTRKKKGFFGNETTVPVAPVGTWGPDKVSINGKDPGPLTIDTPEEKDKDGNVTTNKQTIVISAKIESWSKEYLRISGTVSIIKGTVTSEGASTELSANDYKFEAGDKRATTKCCHDEIPKTFTGDLKGGGLGAGLMGVFKKLGEYNVDIKLVVDGYK